MCVMQLLWVFVTISYVCKLDAYLLGVEMFSRSDAFVSRWVYVYTPRTSFYANEDCQFLSIKLARCCEETSCLINQILLIYQLLEVIFFYKATVWYCHLYTYMYFSCIE